MRCYRWLTAFRSMQTLFLCLLLVPAGLCAQSSAEELAETQTQLLTEQPPAAAPPAEVQPAVAPPLSVEVTLERIMAHPDWIGNAPERAYWADDGNSIYYFQKRPGEEHRDLVQIDLSGQVLRTVADEHMGSADHPGGVLSPDRSRKVYSREGDLYVKELPSGEVRQLTRTAARESRPGFMADGRRISFQRGQVVYVRDLASGLEAQVAELILEEDPDEKQEEPDYLRDQQPRLLDFIRTEKQKREAQMRREMQQRRVDPTRVVPPFYLGDDVETHGLSLSPNGRWMVVVLGKKEEDQGRAGTMASWVTESGYVEVEEVRPKVGTGEGAGERLMLLDLVAHEIHELSTEPLPGIGDDPLADLRQAARDRREQRDQQGDEDEIEEEELPLEQAPIAVLVAEQAESEGEERSSDEAEVVEIEAEAGDVQSAQAQSQPEGEEEEEERAEPRPVTFDSIEWSQDGSQVAVMAFSVDHKDRWIATLDVTEKISEPALRPLHRLHDEAWINWSFNDMGWLPDGERFWYLSEESGYSQLYLAEPRYATTRQLTSGSFLVDNVAPSRDGTWLYFDANPDHPGIYDTYRVATSGGEMEQMSTLGGRTTSVLSPDGYHLLLTHSSTTRPPELFLQLNEPGAEAVRLTETASAEFLAIDWVEPEIRAVPSSHVNRPIYSRIYRPQGAMTEPMGRPAVVFVHGAGYLQNAHQGWSGYFREFMFHTLLTRAGYTVLDMDYRASRGYGRDWRTAIYRQMGTPELEDLQDGVEWLVHHEGIDRGRIGVYGGSYGGFMTFLALFKDPDLFAAGAALRPVTDWAHYNHPYTSNILNTPDIDPEAYERSSPIEFADGLAKPLLICAPMQDDNVFFQDTVRLVQRLIELEKENWEVAIYPVEHHGFRQPSSWLDEYRRIFKLFEENLK